MQRSPRQWLNVVAFLVCWHGKLGVRAELSPPASTRRMACMRRERTQKAWRTGCQSEGSNERERADTGAHPQGWLGAGWLQAASGKQFADCLTECVKALGDEELDHTKLFACSSRFLSGSACVLLPFLGTVTSSIRPWSWVSSLSSQCFQGLLEALQA